MRRSWAAVALVAACVLLSALGLWRVVTRPEPTPLTTADRVVVVGIPGLLWSDVHEDSTPALAALAQDASVGSLTTRGATSFACPRDGWVTLGAGNRAYYAPHVRGCGHYLPGSGDPAQVIARNADQAFGAEPGSLGRALPCTKVFGPGAELAVLGSGRVTSSARPRAAQWATAWDGCPLAVVGMPALRAGPTRSPTLARVDALLQGVVSAVAADPGTLLLVVGMSDSPGISPQLHVAMAMRSEDRAAALASASTDRSPYVQLIDVAPTVLSALSIPQPADMVGRPFTLTPAPAPNPTALVTAEVAAAAAGHVSTPVVWIWVVLNVVLALAAAVLLRRRPRGGDVRLRLAAVAVAAIPVASLLANLLPWATADHPGLVLSLALVGAAVALTGVAFAGPWRRSRYGPAVVLAVVGALALGLDVLSGSTLQLNGPIGYNPIVAGRFTGFGNMPYAVFATCSIIAVAATLAGHSRRAAVLLVGLAGVTIVLLDGAPGLGTDFGGVLALVPAFLVMGVLAGGRRLSLANVLAAVGAGVVVVAGLAVLDYVRPEASQTHLGRFVGQLMDGTAAEVVQRKATANLNILLHSPVAVLVPVLVAALWALFRPGGAGRALWASGGPGRAAVAGVAIAAGIGSLVNDSGVAVFVAAGAIAVPLLLSAAAAAPETGIGAPERQDRGLTASGSPAGPAG